MDGSTTWVMTSMESAANRNARVASAEKVQNSNS
jgi:hypothetical protein